MHLQKKSPVLGAGGPRDMTYLWPSKSLLPRGTRLEWVGALRKGPAEERWAHLSRGEGGVFIEEATFIMALRGIWEGLGRSGKEGAGAWGEV